MTILRAADDTPRWGRARRFVATVVAALFSLVTTHTLAAVLRHLGPEDAPPAAGALTLAALAVAIAGSLAWPRRDAMLGGAVAGAAAVAFLAALTPGSWAAALALVPAGAAAVHLGGWLGRRLPADLDATVSRRRVLAAVWAVLALVSVVQAARLATFVTDPSQGLFLTTENPFWNGHQCLPAYLYGAELTERGEADVYDPGHYPALDPEAAPVTRVEGMPVEDPFMYPPQFLLLPRLALSLTDDWDTLRVGWFGIQVALFFAVAAWLALWAGGRAGRAALWCLPLVFVAFPVMHNFQFGQFHLAAVALAVAAMVAFDRGRRASGGALLATAILAKMFPAVLLLPLVARRRFRELAWTAAFGIAFTALALVVLGPAPFQAFFHPFLANLSSGAAVAFDEAWPELAGLVVADNQGPFGMVLKLGALGVAGADKALAAWVTRVFTLVVLALAFFLAGRLLSGPRPVRAVVLLGLLGLASLGSPGSWGDYVPVTAVWLLTFLVPVALRSVRAAWVLGTAAFFQVTLLGTMPLGDWAPVDLMVPVSLVNALVLLGLFAAALALRPAVLVAEGEEGRSLPAREEALPRAA